MEELYQGSDNSYVLHRFSSLLKEEEKDLSDQASTNCLDAIFYSYLDAWLGNSRTTIYPQTINSVSVDYLEAGMILLVIFGSQSYRTGSLRLDMSFNVNFAKVLLAVTLNIR